MLSFIDDHQRRRLHNPDFPGPFIDELPHDSADEETAPSFSGE
jgi:hypothetical protein